jgi:hypothetical protein
VQFCLDGKILRMGFLKTGCRGKYFGAIDCTKILANSEFHSLYSTANIAIEIG